MYPFSMSSNGGFKEYFRGFSVAMLPGQEREDVEKGGKIIMPPNALEALTRLNVTYPMLFKLRNPKSKRITHCGVLEFVADDDNVYLPHWMMMNLSLEEGGRVEVESASLPVATFSRFQPQCPDFLDIYNPKAVLENTLRGFACLTAGDIINIKYNQKNYELSVLETQPGDAVSIIECDMNVDFAPPVGYVEPQVEKPPEPEEEEMVTDVFVPFSGAGVRLDGKTKKRNDLSPLPKRVSTVRGIPDNDWTVGTLVFMRNVRPKETAEKKDEEKFQPFSGAGNSLS
ncbi:unnamed protein product [Nezara viridula]|uniref:Ubiquitin fusion degradation protein 1 homolog n=1 Tax=Nezara viridula TaxID=85310 RepID=A0A9P0E6B8_NEZVI|nr:unnamed protein product [Nezara viridula]